MPVAGVLPWGGFDDLDHGAVPGLDETHLAAGRSVIDNEVEVATSRLARRCGSAGGGVLDAGDPERIVTPGGAKASTAPVDASARDSCLIATDSGGSSDLHGCSGRACVTVGA